MKKFIQPHHISDCFPVQWLKQRWTISIFPSSSAYEQELKAWSRWEVLGKCRERKTEVRVYLMGSLHGQVHRKEGALRRGWRGAAAELVKKKKKRMWCHRNHRKEWSRVEGVNCTESWENKWDSGGLKSDQWMYNREGVGYQSGHRSQVRVAWRINERKQMETPFK